MRISRSLVKLHKKSFVQRSFQAFSTFPSAATQKYAEDSLKYAAHTYDPVPVVFSEANGCVVKDFEGKEYLDFLAAYSAVNQGHCHPKIIKAMEEQLHKVTLSARAFLNDQFLPYCKFMTETFGYERIVPMNTGVEGGETALKLARRWGYRIKGIPSNEAILVFAKDNFWGRTLAAVSSSTDPSAYEDFGPFMPGFETVEYDNLSALRSLFEEKGKNICAYMLEPVQGEAGVKIPSEGYLRGVRDLCDEFNILMVADEVQSGLGRTGKMLACEHENVRPDVIILGKALSGGLYPVSAVLADDHIMKNFTPGSHGSTYGGNSLACAVGIASIQVLLDERLCENSLRLGEVFRKELFPLLEEVDEVTALRGRGLMNALVMKGDTSAKNLTMKLAENGILAKPTHGDTIRFTPPLVITEEQILTATKTIKDCVKELFQK